MGLSSYFKKNIGTKQSEAVNEASGTDVDTSFRKATIKDNLSNIFSGMGSGIMVRSALASGKIPHWTGTDVTYPFVGIVGYSTHSAVASVSTREVGMMNDFFGALLSDSAIRNSMNSVVSNGGFNPNSYIFYPHIPIETLGSRGGKRSLNVFFPSSINAAVQRTLGTNAVQQCLDLDENGNLTVNASKKPSTIFYSANSSSASSSNGEALCLAKIRVEDLVRIAENMGGKKELCDALELAFRSFVSMVRKAIEHGENPNNTTPGIFNSCNPNAGMFFDFMGEVVDRRFTKDLLNKQVELNPDRILPYFRKWLDESDVYTICDKLISKYYFPTDFGNTYCMKYLSSFKSEQGVDSSAVDRDFLVYRKCLENANYDTVETLKGIANGVTNTSSTSDKTPSASDYDVTYNGFLDLSDMSGSLMKICRLMAKGSDRSVFCFDVRTDKEDLKRDFGSEITRHRGSKRVFVKVDTATARRIQSLDYGEFFRRFQNQLDASAKSEFKFIRVNGSTETFSYDEALEKSIDGSSSDLVFALYDAYSKNSQRIEEPSTLNLSYFIDEDFISSGYEHPSVGMIDMGSHKIPEVLKIDRYGVTEDRIRSSFFYSNKRVNFVNGVNREMAKILPRKHGLHRKTENK